MLRELILHIGRHKTGTTALQRFFLTNSEWLRAQGYIYPESGLKGFGHHEIAVPLSKKPNKQIAQLISPKMKVIRDLRNEIENSENLTTILSSEGFQNCSPRAIRKLFNNFETKIVVYIRNHMDYLASAYVQRVHATDYCGTINDFRKKIFKADYLQFLNSWEKQFPGRLIVRRYEKNALYDGDIIKDFCNKVLGLETLRGATLIKNDPNPSLNRKIVAFKLFLNREKLTQTYPKGVLYKSLSELNSHFTDGKFLVDRRSKEAMNLRFNAKERIVARKYFQEDMLFNYDDSNTLENVFLSKEEMHSMKQKLEEIIAGSF